MTPPAPFTRPQLEGEKEHAAPTRGSSGDCDGRWLASATGRIQELEHRLESASTGVQHFELFSDWVRAADRRFVTLDLAVAQARDACAQLRGDVEDRLRESLDAQLAVIRLRMDDLSAAVHQQSQPCMALGTACFGSTAEAAAVAAATGSSPVVGAGDGGGHAASPGTGSPGGAPLSFDLAGKAESDRSLAQLVADGVVRDPTATLEEVRAGLQRMRNEMDALKRDKGLMREHLGALDGRVDALSERVHGEPKSLADLTKTTTRIDEMRFAMERAMDAIWDSLSAERQERRFVVQGVGDSVNSRVDKIEAWVRKMLQKSSFDLALSHRDEVTTVMTCSDTFSIASPVSGRLVGRTSRGSPTTVTPDNSPTRHSRTPPTARSQVRFGNIPEPRRPSSSASVPAAAAMQTRGPLPDSEDDSRPTLSSAEAEANACASRQPPSFRSRTATPESTRVSGCVQRFSSSPLEAFPSLIRAEWQSHQFATSPGQQHHNLCVGAWRQQQHPTPQVQLPQPQMTSQVGPLTAAGTPVSRTLSPAPHMVSQQRAATALQAREPSPPSLQRAATIACQQLFVTQRSPSPPKAQAAHAPFQRLVLHRWTTPPPARSPAGSMSVPAPDRLSATMPIGVDLMGPRPLSSGPVTRSPSPSPAHTPPRHSCLSVPAGHSPQQQQQLLLPRQNSPHRLALPQWQQHAQPLALPPQQPEAVPRVYHRSLSPARIHREVRADRPCFVHCE